MYEAEAILFLTAIRNKVVISSLSSPESSERGGLDCGEYGKVGSDPELDGGGVDDFSHEGAGLPIRGASLMLRDRSRDVSSRNFMVQAMPQV